MNEYFRPKFIIGAALFWLLFIFLYSATAHAKSHYMADPGRYAGSGQSSAQAHCMQELADERFIAEHKYNGTSKEELLSYLKPVGNDPNENISQAEHDQIIVLVDEIYAIDREGLWAWWSQLLSECVKRHGTHSFNPYTLQAATLNYEQAAVIYAMARAATGYPLPEKAPLIHLVSSERLRQMFCERPMEAECDTCARKVVLDQQCMEMTLHVEGLQIGADIFIDENTDFGTPLGASVLFHEMIHYLQREAKGDATNCMEWVEREREAYTLQAQQLKNEGAPFMVIRSLLSTMNHLRCDS